jgi:hypothetical protein
MTSFARLCILSCSLCLIWGFTSASLGAEPLPQVDSKIDDLLKRATEESKTAAEQKQNSASGTPGDRLGTLPYSSKEIEAAEERYFKFAWKNREDVFWWQSVSSRILFCVVIGVVVVGLFLSWLQLSNAHKMPTTLTVAPVQQQAQVGQQPNTQEAKPPNVPAAATDSASVSTVEVSATGFKITSSVIGLIILLLSIVFLLLYLKYIYPITSV